MQLLDLYFDIDGFTLEPLEWQERYPEGRLRLKRDSTFGVAISTEFVGVNHNPDPLGSPFIFETIAHVDGDVVFSKWSGNKDDALRVHSSTLWRGRFGAGLVWRAVCAARRAKARAVDLWFGS